MRRVNGNPGFERRGARPGFTLLEVILGLALTVILLGLVSVAIDTYWRACERGRLAVENAQLARALLNRIADDLRASVTVAPDHSAAVAGLAESAAASELEALEAGLTNGDDDDDDDDDDTTDPLAGVGEDGAVDPAALEQESAVATENAISVAEAPLGAYPGVYGNQYELQVDVAKALRSDEFRLVDQSSLGAALPLGVTTISYYVQNGAYAAPGGTGATGAPTASPTQAAIGLATGMIRREANRSVVAATGDQAINNARAQRVEPMADEVAQLEFRYFDGTEWLLTWDSEQMQSPPVAVEILLTLHPVVAAQRPSFFGARPEEAPYDLYRLVVHLPSSTPGGMSSATVEDVSATADDGTGAAPDASGASSSGSGGSTSGSASGGSATGGASGTGSAVPDFSTEGRP